MFGFIKDAANKVADLAKRTVINGGNLVFDYYSGLTNIYASILNEASHLITGGDYTANTKISSFNGKSINTNEKTYIVIHGFQSGADKDWVKNIETELAKTQPSANVLALDWLDGGKSFNYADCANKTLSAGVQLAKYLAENQIDPSKVTIIGHSLGAHVASFTSQALKQFTGKLLSEIIALDPAGVKFATILQKYSLDKSSADKVTAIHTNETFGTSKNVGHLDVFVNVKDFLQPNSNHAIANHSYAQELFTQLLQGYRFKMSDGSYWDMNSLNEWNGKRDVTTIEKVSPNLDWHSLKVKSAISDSIDALSTQTTNNQSEISVSSGYSLQSGVNAFLIDSKSGQASPDKTSAEFSVNSFLTSSVFGAAYDNFSQPDTMTNNAYGFTSHLFMGSLSASNANILGNNNELSLNDVIIAQPRPEFMA